MDRERDAYPYFRGDRYVRNPYEERTLTGMARENDPYAARSYDSTAREPRTRCGGLSEGRSEPPPLITLTSSPRDYKRSSIDPEERRGPVSSILRYTESPAPRASRHRIDGFRNTFGDVNRQPQQSRERLQYDPSGPSRDPFTRTHAVADRPCSGMNAPRNPFQPGGSMYNYEQGHGRRHISLEPDLSTLPNDQERRRYNHYRGGLGESWGVAEFRGYERRCNHEERTRRSESRVEERRSREYDW